MSRVLPILFNTEMVRAILDGRKTVTRRIMKPQPWKIGEGEYECRHEKGFFNSGGNNWMCKQCGCGVVPMKGGSYFNAPYQPGDILYVRETWNYIYDLDGNDQTIEDTGRYVYYADNPNPCSDWVDPNTGMHRDAMPWKPSIHMPKEAARIWLKVTDVRVERLQDITVEQAIREGIAAVRYDVPTGREESAALEWFPILWDSTIKKSDIDKYGWKANPWVWVIEFERCGKPESEE